MMFGIPSRSFDGAENWSFLKVALIAVVGLGYLLFAILAGLLASTGANILSFGMAMVLIAACLVAVPVRYMMPTLLVVTCVLIGLLEYFGRIKQGLWVPYGLALLMLVRIPGIYVKSPGYGRPGVSTPLSGLILLFISAVLMSVALNAPPAVQAMAGGKNYLLLWVIFFVVAWGALPASSIERMFRWTFWLAFLQFPVVLYQYFFIALERSTRGGRYGVAWDAVVGTFGGDPMRGGASGTMAFFLIVALIYAIALLRVKAVSWTTVALLFVVTGITAGLAEIKVIVLLLPIGLMVIMADDVKKRPVVFVLALFGTFAGMVGLLLVYNAVHYGGRANDLYELWNEVFGYSTDATHINRETGELGRATAFSIWWTESFNRDLLHAIFGYGPGAARSDSLFSIGELAKRFPFRLERSAAVQMLWEIGLWGALLYALILTRAVFLARSLLRSSGLSVERRATISTCMAVFLMSFVMWPYGREILEVPAQSVLLVICLGYIALLGVDRQLGCKAEVGTSGLT